jgi:hypothetical protein
MSFIAKTTTNTLPSISVATNQILDLLHSGAHKEVVSRLLVEALHRPHRKLEELMHSLHDYLLGYHLGGKMVDETYINLKIFKPFRIELDPMDKTTEFMSHVAPCRCGGIHCQDWQYEYIDAYGDIYLTMRSYYRSTYIQRGAAHARINRTSLDDIEEESDTELFEEPSSEDDANTLSFLQSCRISRIPSPVPSNHCLNYWCVCRHEDDFNQPSYPVPSNHGYDCWCRKCCGEDEEDEEDEIYNYMSVQQDEDDEGEPNFVKDDRGGINYYCKRHDKREFRAKSAKEDAKKQSSFKKHFKKRGARNPRTNLRRETRNSKRKYLDVSSDEEDEILQYEPATNIKPAQYETFIKYETYDNPPLEPQEHFDADLPEKDDRYHRKNRHTKREKHIRDQEKMARELGIPVARKMKRRDIPTSRYNRHKASLDMGLF